MNLIINFISKSADKSIILSQLYKSCIIRIVFSAVILLRVYQILEVAIKLEEHISHIQYILAVATITAAVTLLIGLFSSLANIILAILLPLFDIHFNCQTLGTSIACLLAIGLAFTKSGSLLSLDCQIRSKFPKLAYLYEFPKLNAKYFNYTFTYLVLVYWINSLLAIALHMKDPTWISGQTPKILMLNSYLNNAYALNRWVFSEQTEILNFLSYTITIAQTLFQVLLFPFLFFRYGRLFVMYYGFAFFFYSLICLQLSYLPHMEILIWALIFIGNKKIRTLELFYDDYCNLCRKTIKFIHFFNFNNTLILRPLSSNRDKLKQLKIPDTIIKNQMVSICNGQVFYGFNTYFVLTRKIPIFIFFWPIFWILKISSFGNIVYNSISTQREKYFGVCSLAYNDEVVSLKWKLRRNQIRLLNRSYKGNMRNYLVLNILTTYSIFFLFVTASRQANPGNNKLNYLNKYVTYSGFRNKSLGLEVPDVFNETDLKMGDRFLVITRKNLSPKDDNNNISLISYDGSRRNYPHSKFDWLLLKNHGADNLYFGYTLKINRALINLNEKSLKQIQDKTYKRLQIMANMESNDTFTVCLIENNQSTLAKVDKIKEMSILTPKMLGSYSICAKSKIFNPTGVFQLINTTKSAK